MPAGWTPTRGRGPQRGRAPAARARATELRAVQRSAEGASNATATYVRQGCGLAGLRQLAVGPLTDPAAVAAWLAFTGQAVAYALPCCGQGPFTCGRLGGPVLIRACPPELSRSPRFVALANRPAQPTPSARPLRDSAPATDASLRAATKATTFALAARFACRASPPASKPRVPLSRQLPPVAPTLPPCSDEQHDEFDEHQHADQQPRPTRSREHRDDEDRGHDGHRQDHTGHARSSRVLVLLHFRIGWSVRLRRRFRIRCGCGLLGHAAPSDRD
jgi:hypothetical protein